MATIQKHDDFGAKIGGARKDLWRQRGLRADDLSEMNEREAEKYVKKDNIWKKNDYQAMIDNGIPFDVVYFIKTVRDSVKAVPFYLRTDDTPEKRLARQKQYIDTVREIQGMVEGVRTKADALKVFERHMVNGAGYFELRRPGVSGVSYAAATEKGRANPLITNELAHALLFRTEGDYDSRITKKARQEQFGVPRENKIPRGYEIRFNDGKHTWSANNDWKPDTYFVAKRSRILQKNFETRDEALRWAQEHANGRDTNRKIKFVPPQLEHIERGGPDYRRGADVNGQTYLDIFGFKGGEFGNWMSPLDRQASLNYGYDALKDLADALHIADSDISYGGHLSIAFGARGVGSFAAHYEPMRQVINLTKMRGAGSLAHEWWHGLDDYLGMKLAAGGYLSDNPGKLPLMAQLIQTMKYKSQTAEQAAQSAETRGVLNRNNAERWLASIFGNYIGDVADTVKTDYETRRQAFLRGEAGSVDRLSELKKSLTGHIIRKKEREILLFYEHQLRPVDVQTEPVIGRTMTDYYRDSKEMGKICQKENGYWESDVELTARAFATYVMDTLGRRSDYLVGHAESAVATTEDGRGNPQVIRAYPQGEERKAINEVFDQLMLELKLRHILTHDERAAPITISAPVPQNVAVLSAVAAHSGQTFDSGAIPADIVEGNQLSLFDIDGISGYMEELEDEDEMEL